MSKWVNEETNKLKVKRIKDGMLERVQYDKIKKRANNLEL